MMRRRRFPRVRPLRSRPDERPGAAEHDPSAAPELDQAFVAYVRDRLDPALQGSGFAFVSAESTLVEAPRVRRRRAVSSSGGGVRATRVSYAAAPEPFGRRYPATSGLLRHDGDRLDLQVDLDVDRRRVTAQIEGWEPAALLAAVRAGPGAPARRRRLGEDAAGTTPEATVDRTADLLRRLFDGAVDR